MSEEEDETFDSNDISNADLEKLTSSEHFDIVDYVNDMIVIDYCLEHEKFNVNDKVLHGEETLLHHASAYNKLQMAKMLIYKFKADVECRTRTRRDTPLLLACKNYNCKIVELLFENDVKVDNKNNLGMTPLMYACIGSHADLMETLLLRGANANEQNLDGKTPLIYACSLCPPSHVRLLLEHGADIHVEDNKKKSPLMYAAEYCNPETVKMLIDNGATEYDIIHAYKIAKKTPCDSCIDILYKHLPKKKC